MDMDKIKEQRAHAYYVMWETAKEYHANAYEPEEIKAWQSIVIKMEREYQKLLRK
jgi:hypothetical protein